MIKLLSNSEEETKQYGKKIAKELFKGAVVVLDRRIYEKRYGSIFTASMPECRQLYEPLSDITSRIKSFIFN